MKKIPSPKRLALGLVLVVSNLFPPSVFAQTFAASPATTSADWYMAGANPQRTSWVPNQPPDDPSNQTQISGVVHPIWYRSFEPFVNGKIQMITVGTNVYVATSRGLYDLDADTGAVKWVYPTELPLGHSPTVLNGIAYVPGMDHRIHAIASEPDTSALPTDSATGYRINNQVRWIYEAPSNSQSIAAGFETNPLVVNNTVYAGNRDGTMYALDAASGSLLWRYRTGDSIRQSAAYSNGVIFFASMDAYAYALDAANGNLIWRSAKLPGAGFYSWWPVIYHEPQSGGDYVIFSGSLNYTWPHLAIHGASVGQYKEVEFEDAGVFDLPGGSYLGALTNETSVFNGQTQTLTNMEANLARDYMEKNADGTETNYSIRRRLFVLNQSNGQEYTFDSDGDGREEFAPFFWGETHSGNRFPPIVGSDGLLYAANAWIARPYIPRGGAVGWKFGTSSLRLISNHNQAVDEPYGFSSGGDVIYSHQSYYNEAFAANIRTTRGSNEWVYYAYESNPQLEGVYDYPDNPDHEYDHTARNAMIPHRGKLYVNDNNMISAWGITSTPAQNSLEKVLTVPATGTVTSVQTGDLQAELLRQIQRFDANGDGTLDHLRPGYHGQGLADMTAGSIQAATNNYATPSVPGHAPTANQFQYFSNPAETIYALLRALPYVTDATWNARLRTYIQSEFNNYNPCTYAHMGWNSGSAREAYAVLPEVQSNMNASGPQTSEGGGFWDFPQFNFYAVWRYVRDMNLTQAQAAAVFDASCRSRLQLPPATTNPSGDNVLIDFPYILNAYIAGYYGYCELVKFVDNRANCSTSAPNVANVQNTLDQLLSWRSTRFSTTNRNLPTDTIYNMNYNFVLNSARNFINLTPELGVYLHANALSQVENAVDFWNDMSPYWFLSKFDETYGEGVVNQLYDVTQFQARALVLRAPREELIKYLDAPAFARGDLFYIQNLVALIEAPSAGPSPTFADVPFSHPYHDVIEMLYQAGYTAGCNTNPLIYCPEATMNRAESSVFVERGIHTATYDPPAPTSQVFADMPLDSWAAKWVTGLWNDQYTAGCGTNPLVYCPWQGHTRAEGCVFYLRMMRGATYDPPQPTQQTFVDVPLEAWYAKWVQAAYDAGLLTACQTTPDGRFCPDGPLTRALAAYMMVQAKGLH